MSHIETINPNEVVNTSKVVAYRITSRFTSRFMSWANLPYVIAIEFRSEWQVIGKARSHKKAMEFIKNHSTNVIQACSYTVEHYPTVAGLVIRSARIFNPDVPKGAVTYYVSRIGRSYGFVHVVDIALHDEKSDRYIKVMNSAAMTTYEIQRTIQGHMFRRRYIHDSIPVKFVGIDPSLFA